MHKTSTPSLAALFALMLCLLAAPAQAETIDVEQAKQAVVNFHKKGHTTRARRAPMSKSTLRHAFTQKTASGDPAVYAFNTDGGGFVLASANDATVPVLGYSDNGTFDPNNIPDGLKYLMGEYAKEIASLGRRKAGEQLPTPDYDVEVTDPIKPLMETKWGQMRPYNLESPLSIVGNAATGCMTTAIAQIMRYHKWPKQGYGSCEFNVKEGYNTIFTVRDYYTRHYNWDVMHPHTNQYTMRDSKNYDTNAADVASVSQLMFDIGVALSTDYTISGVSSAVEVRIIPMLTSYFNYDPSLEFVSLAKEGPESFNHMLIEELKADRPVYLQGGPLGYGHAFVCDGYNGQGHFHINWGWEGKSDGYYLITGLTPKDQGTGGGSSSGYSENLKMIRHIMPYNGVAPRPQFKVSKYSVETDANGNYLSAQFGVTKDRNIRGQLGVLVIDTEGNGKIFWDKNGNYTQICTAGTEGVYYNFHVNVDPSWIVPGTRAYYIYKECGTSEWNYAKDYNNNYCCIEFDLSDGKIVAKRNTSDPNYNGVPGNYNLNEDYEYELGEKITSLSQIKSGHVYAIARHSEPGFASINPVGGVLKGRTTFDAKGTTAFVFTGNATNGYTIKSAVANAYLPVLTTTEGNGNVVSLGWSQEKFAIEDFNGYIADGLQIKSLGSSYGSGKVYLHCTGTTNDFLGWRGYDGANSQMDIYEVTVNGQQTMPGASEKLVVTYNIFLGNNKIGTRVYEETVGQAPTKDFIPYYVSAEGFPTVITSDVAAYDIHTSYNDKLPIDPSQYFNIGFTQGGTTYWWYNTGDSNGYCKEKATAPNADDKTAQWTLVGDWLNGFVVKNANQGKIIWARDVANNKAVVLAVDQQLDDKTFMLEHRAAGYYLHLKGRDMYLAHSSANNVSINSTLDNAANLLTFAKLGEEPTTPDTPVDVTYTVNVVGAPTGAAVEVTVKGKTVVGNTVTLSSAVSPTDVVATNISGYTYSVKVNGTTINVTYAPIPYVVGKKYVIKSVAHTTTGKTYYILPPVSGTKCVITETAPTSEDGVWTVTSVAAQTDGSYNVSFQNGSQYFAFLATTTTANHAVRLSQTDVDVASYWNIQDNLNYWPDKSSDTRFLFLAVKDDYATSNTIGWGSIQDGNKIRSAGYSYQFQFEEYIVEVPVSYNVIITGANGGVTYGGVTYHHGDTITGNDITETGLAATPIDGYTPTVTVIGTTITVTYTPNGPSQETLDLIEDVKAANVKIQAGTVGYPCIDDLDRSDANLAAYFTFIDAQCNLATATPEFYEELRASFEHLAANYTDVKKPEAGHAYKISVRSNDGNTHWYMKNDGKMTTNANEAAVFVMGNSGNENFNVIFASNDNGNSRYLLREGASRADYKSSVCDIKLKPMVKESKSTFITADAIARFGTFSFSTASDGWPSVWDESSESWQPTPKVVMDGTFTSAIELTEVDYPYTQPKLTKGNEDDKGSYASIYLPFPMQFPDGVEAYKGTQERNANGKSYLALERVDTNYAVAAGGYIIYSETFPAGVPVGVQPAAAALTDGRSTSDAVFIGSTEGPVTDDYAMWQEKLQGKNAYVLAKKNGIIGFYRYVGQSFPKGKAIWIASETQDAETVKFDFNDAIEAIRALHAPEGSTEIYDLQGQRLEKVEKGQINIINGKKIMFK